MITDDVRDLLTTLAQANSILVATHIQPDGDAISSLTAVGLLLSQLDKRFTLVCDDPVPGPFRSLALAGRVLREAPAGARFDLLLALDCGDEGRLGRAYAGPPTRPAIVANLDHHITNTRFGDINIVDPAANSTTEILCRLLPHLGVTVTPELATCLLTGLVTDTLGFRTAGVSAETLRTAADLVDAGAELFAVISQALNLKPVSTLLLWQRGLNNMRLEDGLMWSTISHRECLEAGHLAGGSAGLVNTLAEVEQATMGAVMIELADGRVSVGFRCRPPFSVAEIALALGGGGHHLASGCTLPGPLAEAEARVLALSKQAIREHEQRIREAG